MEYEEAMQELTDRVIKVIEELSDINDIYASWDQWGKTKVIDNALNVLKEEYIKDLEKKYL